MLRFEISEELFVDFSSIITLILYTILGADYKNWYYILFHTVLRLEEIAVVLITLVFLSKKKPGLLSIKNFIHCE